MKLLHIIADGNLGGGTTHVLQLLRGLDSAFSQALITQNDSYLLEETKSLNILTFGTNFFLSRFDFRVSFALRNIIYTFKPNIIHVHGGRAAFFLSFSAINIPVVYTIHGLHFSSKRGIFKWLGAFAELWTINQLNDIVFVSNYDLQVARKWNLIPSNARVDVIRNGVDLKNFLKAPITPRWNVGFIGRLEEVKDPLLFIDVMYHLRDRKGVLVGDGTLKDAVLEKIKSHSLEQIVDVVGAVSRKDALQILSGCSLIIMTSHREGLPLVLLEAMAIGVPAVAPAVGGIPEIVLDGETGLLMHTRNPEDFAESIRQLLDNSALLDYMGSQGKQRVQNLFSEPVMLQKLTKLYQQILADV